MTSAKGPLDGKRILVTRAADQAEELASRLEAVGAVALRCPTIRVSPPSDPEPLDAALLGLERYDWVVVTSPNGARAVLTRLEHLGRGPSTLDAVRVAAVGSVTARLLSERGVKLDLVPRDERSHALAEELTPVEGRSILLARSDIADERLRTTLLERGAADVEDVVAYRTVPIAPPPAATKELRLGVEGITFTSPSTVEGFLHIGPEWRDLVGDAVVATIGPVTTAAARSAGFEVLVEAQERSIGGLVEALVRELQDD